MCCVDGYKKQLKFHIHNRMQSIKMANLCLHLSLILQITRKVCKLRVGENCMRVSTDPRNMTRTVNMT
jgi:hypothetical protein